MRKPVYLVSLFYILTSSTETNNPDCSVSITLLVRRILLNEVRDHAFRLFLQFFSVIENK
jgi:hypothetical protein